MIFDILMSMKETPMMKQYMDIKRQYPDKILLFRMGDFFETFGKDAEIASKVLNITLTTRDKNTDPTPLAGFPHHALNQYLPKFIKAGYSVVIADQLEDPKLAKGIVKRGVVRIVTPGTLDDEEYLNHRKQRIMSIFRSKRRLGFSVVDVNNGELFVFSMPDTLNSIKLALTTFHPAEIIILNTEKNLFVGDYPIQLVDALKIKGLENKLVTKFYKVNSLHSFGIGKTDDIIGALAILITYLQEVQKTSLDYISVPKKYSFDNSMILDETTVKNLDLVPEVSINPESSLFSVLDNTKTRMGRRLLYEWVLKPLINIDDINNRLKVVDVFYTNMDLLLEIREHLDKFVDVDRLIGQIGLSRVFPRGLVNLKSSLQQAKEIFQVLEHSEENKYIFEQNFDITIFDDNVKNNLSKLIQIIDETLVDNPPLNLNDGGFIKKGYNSEIDELRDLSTNSKKWLEEFQEKEKARTGISSLKVGFNKVFGYYIEVTKTHKDKVPADYIRKQTLVNSERYITEALKEQEQIILTAHEKLIQRELEEFEKLRIRVKPFVENLKKLSSDIARLDVLSNFAFLSYERGYVKPTLYDFGEKDGLIHIENSRHPVVERFVEDVFIPNDININSKDRLLNIITGPNMSGKSTYIRQVAVVVLMAQIGCFVPASKANISLVDRIFTRVGASDDLSRGRSTFMMEMEEAANILNNATRYSLIILDEIGRGTSTYDGVSIAYAIAEYILQNIKARTLFATHYHELMVLADRFKGKAINLNVAVQENEETGEVLFLRKIKEGGTNKSYGIYVANMAGLPQDVINRAKEVLASFEQGNLFGSNDSRMMLVNSEKNNEKMILKNKQEGKQLNLFNSHQTGIIKELEELDLENCTPIEAFEKLVNWKKRIT